MEGAASAPSTKLVHLQSGRIEEYPIDRMPAYVAVSHAWAENLFPPGVSFRAATGSKALDTLSCTQYESIPYCWVDTLCIDQNDPLDKERQIPLMGSIYGQAEVVVIVTKESFGLTQDYIDTITAAVQDAVDMSTEDPWMIKAQEWINSPKNYDSLKQAMDMLELFTRPIWLSRVWTMQEFILAKRTLWIGSDLKPLRVEEKLFQAVPDVCDTLAIEERFGGKYSKIYSHLMGMASAFLKTIEPTRVMELLGNRTATIPEDEIYGLMAASGVSLKQTSYIGKDKVWALWWEEAIRTGHFRWALLPPSIPNTPEPPHLQRNCIMPSVSVRHLASTNSVLDSVQPYGSVSVQNGTVSMMGHLVGRCTIIRRLGRIQQEEVNGTVFREITLILFASNNWHLALHIAAALGAGRYNPKQRAIIAQVLVENYYRAKLAVLKQRRRAFRPRFRNALQLRIWSDFMTLQAGIMRVMNDAIAFSAFIRNGVVTAETVVLTDGETPEGKLWAVDFGATNDSEKTLLTIVKAPPSALEESPLVSSREAPLHKVGVTTYLELASALKDALYYSRPIFDPQGPLQQFHVGGDTCSVCSTLQGMESVATTVTDDESIVGQESTLALIQNTRLRMRRQMKVIKVKVREARKAEHKRLLRRIGVRRPLGRPLGRSEGRSFHHCSEVAKEVTGRFCNHLST